MFMSVCILITFRHSETFKTHTGKFKSSFTWLESRVTVLPVGKICGKYQRRIVIELQDSCASVIGVQLFQPLCACIESNTGDASSSRRAHCMFKFEGVLVCLRFSEIFMQVLLGSYFRSYLLYK
jgi:hypothetical protein